MIRDGVQVRDKARWRPWQDILEPDDHDLA